MQTQAAAQNLILTPSMLNDTNFIPPEGAPTINSITEVNLIFLVDNAESNSLLFD